MIFIDIIYEKMIIKLPKIVNGNVIYSENGIPITQQDQTIHYRKCSL